MSLSCSGYNCPVEATIQLIGGKYKAVILWHLMGKTLRYSELHKRMPKATDKMLAQQLRELVQHFFDAHILSRLFLTNIFPVKCFGC